MKKIRKLYLIFDKYFKLFFTNKIKILMLNNIIKNNKYYDIPIYIISFNRYEYVKGMVSILKKMGYGNITIIDNNSTNKSLLDYYKQEEVKVIKMKKNYGHTVFYDNIRFIIKRNISFFYLSDPDLLPIDSCPYNFSEIFVNVMKTYPKYSKVGFSLKIDDIPDNYYLKDEVVKWESNFYKKVLGEYNKTILFSAKIDTTFALNSPSFTMPKKMINDGIRVSSPYQMRHLPWYKEDRISENEYLKTKRKDIGTWNGDFTKEEIIKIIEKYKKNL